MYELRGESSSASSFIYVYMTCSCTQKEVSDCNVVRKEDQGYPEQ